MTLTLLPTPAGLSPQQRMAAHDLRDAIDEAMEMLMRGPHSEQSAWMTVNALVQMAREAGRLDVPERLDIDGEVVL